MSDDLDLRVVYRDPKSLVPYERNSRLHAPAQIEKIRASIREFKFTNPILLRDDEKTIGAGHARCQAAILEKLDRVPTITLKGLTAAQWRAYVIADNQLQITGSSWDEGMLRLELGDLRSEGFDLSLIGFDAIELGSLFEAEKEPVDLDEAPEPPAVPVSELGDLWALGPHRILCGDSLDIEQVRHLLNGVTPDLANLDAPYGINAVKGVSHGRGKVRQGHSIPFGGFEGGDRAKGPKRGHVHGPAKNAYVKPGVYDEIIGDDTTDTAVAAYHILANIGVPAICMWGGNYFANHLPPSRCWLVWDKETNGSFADAELAWTNQDKVTMLLRHQWSGLIKASERGQKRVHPTQKPVALAEWVADSIAPKATTVLDLFLGSASTLIAAQNRGLTCFGMELSAAYIDVAIARWERQTGERAVLAETGETFEAVKARRSEVV